MDRSTSMKRQGSSRMSPLLSSFSTERTLRTETSNWKTYCVPTRIYSPLNSVISTCAPIPTAIHAARTTAWRCFPRPLVIHFSSLCSGFCFESRPDLSCVSLQVGSIDYMAPEVVKVWLDESTHYTKQCDMWSLGVVM